MRILVLAHNHPDFHAGGTEIFAHDLFEAYKAEGHEALFVAATSGMHREQRPGTSFQTIGPSGDEVVVWAGNFDRFYLSQSDSFGTLQDMARLFREYQPDILHFHHLLLMGAELPFLARRVLPDAEIVLTLHDYYPICHREGLMLRRETDERCMRASPSSCHACFPDIAANRFLLRERQLKTLLRSVDRFIAPSHFLRERYIDWGLPPDRISVIRNARPDSTDTGNVLRHTRRPTFGYFGNLSPWKGIPVLLQAAINLREAGLDFDLRIHGGALYQTDAFKQQLDRLGAQLGGALTRTGAYDRDTVPALMAMVDWVVVPSIWWENAPLVIQEAQRAGKPLIVSGIGGMAEMVRNEVDGLHAAPNDPGDLARQMRRAIEEPDLRARLAGAIRKPRGMGECVAEHLAFFGDRHRQIEVA